MMEITTVDISKLEGWGSRGEVFASISSHASSSGPAVVKTLGRKLVARVEGQLATSCGTAVLNRATAQSLPFLQSLLTPREPIGQLLGVALLAAAGAENAGSRLTAYFKRPHLTRRSHERRNHAAALPLKRLLAGGLAGAVSKTLVAPLERVTTIIMLEPGQLNFGGAVRRMLADGGVCGIFRGNSATLAKIFPATAIQFAVFHQAKDFLACSSQRTDLSNVERLAAGSVAGALAVTVTYPLENLRTQMAMAGGLRGTLLSVGRQLVARQGVPGLYRGFCATLTGDVLGTALGFTICEMGSRAYQERNGGRLPQPHEKGMIGALSAALSMTMTMPLEVVRRRLQVQGIHGRPVLYRGTLHCLNQIARQEGVKAFYAASLSSYLKVAPSIGCVYFVYECLMRLMDCNAEK